MSKYGLPYVQIKILINSMLSPLLDIRISISDIMAITADNIAIRITINDVMTNVGRLTF